MKRLLPDASGPGRLCTSTRRAGAARAHAGSYTATMFLRTVRHSYLTKIETNFAVTNTK
jgi:hypothetical protein